MKFTYGFRTKRIKGKEYRYFWRYNGTGHKTEIYMGRMGNGATEKREVETEIEYLQSLETELAQRLKDLRAKLQALTATLEP